jgi:glycosyltransferase involved in cell wall biosynthesis
LNIGNVRIGFISELAPTRREAWSGTIGHLLHALTEAGGLVEDIGPILQRPTIGFNLASKIARRLTGRDPMLNRNPFLARQKARAVIHAVQRTGVDVLFAPASSALIAKIPPGIPIAYSSDATLRLLIDYNPGYTGMSESTIARGIALEHEAMHRADLLIYPTQWAAQSAIDDYGIDPARIIVQPFGANLKVPPSRAEALTPRQPGPLRLLFCGANWRRKGGGIALDALQRLTASGVEAELCILGCTPPYKTLPPNVEVIAFLDKNIAEERDRFRQIFLQSDILILPTQTECYGLVFCEAAASGSISLATRTGGVPEVIRDGITGFTIPHDAAVPGQAYADKILSVVQEPGRLEQMRRAARDDFETRLNWGVWGKAVLPAIHGLASR